jgi:hypothetical protein
LSQTQQQRCQVELCHMLQSPGKRKSAYSPCWCPWWTQAPVHTDKHEFITKSNTATVTCCSPLARSSAHFTCWCPWWTQAPAHTQSNMSSESGKTQTQ